MSDKPEKMKLSSADIAELNRGKLKQLFPGVFCETKNEGGELVESIDFEKLKSELGTFSDLFERRRERYGMDWPGKKDAMKLIQQPSLATLKPCVEESVNFDTTENMFIEGDNLEVLKLLQKSYSGKIKLIYIDPPYNTGKEFIYPDKYSESLETYMAYAGLIDDEGKKFSTNTPNEGRFHTKWLNMLYPRLYLARNLLREDGVIFISIDDNEIANLKAVCNDLFGEDNFIANVTVVNNMKGRNDKEHIAQTHENLLIYSKEDYQSFGLSLTEKQLAEYNQKDEEGKLFQWRDLRKRGGADTRTERPRMFFPLYANPESGTLSFKRDKVFSLEIFPMKSDGTEGCWRWGEERVGEHIKKLRVFKVNNKDRWNISYPVYLEDGGDIRRSKPKSTWIGSEYSSDSGTKLLRNILPNIDAKRMAPKPLGLLKVILAQSTRDNDIILDFFSGSCTTAHAVFDLNKEDGNNRRFIMVQLPEPCEEAGESFKAGYKNIADIGKERIRRVITKIEEEQAEKAKDAAGALPGMAEEQAKLDLGFKALKLDKSNFMVWDGSDVNMSEEQLAEKLELFVDHIDPDASQEDILYELLLKAGFMPTEKVEKLVLAGKTVFSIADGGLLICLEDEITKELISEIATAEPIQFICLDKGFKGNDQLKANAVQTFKAYNQGKDKTEHIVFRTV